MMWSVRWSGASHSDVLRMHWRLAGKICGAVLAFAESGDGEVEDLGTRFYLRIPGAAAIFRLDEAMRTIDVQRIFAVR